MTSPTSLTSLWTSRLRLRIIAALASYATAEATEQEVEEIRLVAGMIITSSAEELEVNREKITAWWAIVSDREFPVGWVEDGTKGKD